MTTSNRMRSYKNYILLSVIVLSQLHVLFRGMDVRVDWFIFIDYTRRIDYAVMYLCKHLIYVIYAYCILFPRGINNNIKVFIFILSVLDLFHFFASSHIGFAFVKLFLALSLLIIYKKTKK